MWLNLTQYFWTLNLRLLVVSREAGIEWSHWDYQSKLARRNEYLQWGTGPRMSRSQPRHVKVSHTSIDYLPLVCGVSGILQARKATKNERYEKVQNGNIVLDIIYNDMLPSFSKEWLVANCENCKRKGVCILTHIPVCERLLVFHKITNMLSENISSKSKTREGDTVNCAPYPLISLVFGSHF